MSNLTGRSAVRFNAAQHEGPNYTSTGELNAVFCCAPGGIDPDDYGYAPVADTYS